LKNLKDHKPYNMPIYDFEKKQRLLGTTKLFPSRVVIVEGHLLFTHPEVRDLLHLKIFVDADDDVRLSRRILKMQDEHIEKIEQMLVKYKS